MSRNLQAAISDILSPYNRSDAPGGVVALAVQGEPVARVAVGLASLELGVANQPATRMQIASVTKHMTCAGILQLAHEGRIDVDGPVGRWLPGLPAAQARPTLRQLMNHTGGIRCYLDQALYNGYAMMPGGMPRAIQLRQADVNFEPGQGSSYCNGGYLLLTMVIEEVTGKSLGDYLRDTFFAPLGMHATAVPRTCTQVMCGAASSYLAARNEASGWRHGMQLTEELFGDGGAWSSVDDMLRWASFLRSAAGPVSLDSLAQRPRLANGWLSDYGCGLITESWRGLSLVNHAGGLPGVSSWFAMLPGQGIDLVMLFNRNAPVIEIGKRILEAALGDRLAPETPPPAFADHAALRGDYLEPETGFMFGFDECDAKLGLKLFGGSAFPLDGGSTVDGSLPFSADVGTGTLRFRAAASDGLCEAVEFLDAGRWRSASRIEGERSSPAEFLRGTEDGFYSGQAAARLDLDVENGEPVVRFTGEYGRATYRAEVLARDLLRFWPGQFPGGMIARIVRSGEAADAVVVSTGRTRRTAFKRMSR